MIELVCERCSGTFHVKAYRAKTARFCSRMCKAQFLGAPHFVAMTSKPWNHGNKHRKGLRPTNSFKDGHTPWNKGLKGIHLSVSSEFKQGRHQPSDNLGTVKIRTHRGTQRAWVKIAEPDRWDLLARHIYAITHDLVIPKNMVIHHIDGDSLNDDPANLMMVTRSQHAKLHSHALTEARVRSLKLAATEQQDI